MGSLPTKVQKATCDAATGFSALELQLEAAARLCG